MKNVKLMIVNAHATHQKKFIGQVFEATPRKRTSSRDRYQLVGRGALADYSVNPIETDEDLTIRVGTGPDDVLFHLRKVSKASPRKLLVRALKRIAKERGYTDAYIRKFGMFSGVGDWARSWADWYFDNDGNFNSVYVDWLHGTEHDPINGDEWRDFIEAEFDAL